MNFSLEIGLKTNLSNLPKIKDVYAGVGIAQKENPDLIIAIGGGTVIDMAKLINILSSQQEHSFINIIKNFRF